MVTELHKNTKKENIVGVDHTIVRVYPESLSELKYYMEYGEGYSREIYEHVLNTKMPLYFYVDLLNETFTRPQGLIYYYDDNVYFLNERLQDTGYIYFFMEQMGWNVDELKMGLIRGWLGMDEEVNKGNVFRLFRLKFDNNIGFLIHNKLNETHIEDIMRMLPKNVERVVLDGFAKWVIRDLSMLPNLKTIYGKVSVRDGGEFKRRGGIIDKVDVMGVWVPWRPR